MLKQRTITKPKDRVKDLSNSSTFIFIDTCKKAFEIILKLKIIENYCNIENNVL